MKTKAVLLAMLLVVTGTLIKGQTTSVSGIGNPSFVSAAASLVCDTVFSFPTIDTWPGGITTDGSILYSNGNNNLFIYKHAFNGTLIDSLPHPFNAPTNYVGGDIDFDGTNLLVFAEQSDTLYKVDPATGAVVQKYLVGPCTLDCYGVAYDGTGIWISDYATDMIYKTDPGTGAVLKTLNLPNNSLILPIKFINGNLYGLGISPPQVLHIDTTTGAILSTQPWCLGYPTGFFSLNNNIWSCSSMISVGGTQRIYAFETSPLADEMDVFTASGVDVFPNPSQGKFNVRLPNSGDKGIIRVSNLVGEIIYENEYDSEPETEVILPRVANGMYMLKLTDRENTLFGKIVIENE
jgi:hypothetical protein